MIDFSSNQYIPNPSAFSTAANNFSLSFSFEEYSGKSKWLKHVLEHGNLSVSGPCLPTKKGREERPLIGALSEPVENCKNFFLYLSVISLWMTSQSHDIIIESFV